MKKINIAELLKDCPRGMELDCLMYEDVCFDYVDELNIIHCYIQHETYKTSLTFNQYGTPNSNIKSKCVIFPKGKTTWDGFHRPFKDGDVLSYQYKGYKNRTIYIYMQHSKMNTTYYVALSGDSDSRFMINDKEGHALNSYDDSVRLATEEEKKKLFDAIKENSYKWNHETKTLEKLEQTWTIQCAKDGDVLAFDDETIVIFKDLYNNTSFHSYCHIEDGIFTISKEDVPDWWRAKGFYPATEKQYTLLFRKIKEAGYHWNPETKTLEKLPKFKIGDKIIKKNGLRVPFVITGVSDVYYWSTTENSVEVLRVAEQDEYELVPTKFDITTLKPLQPVLVRDTNGQVWTMDLFSHKIDTNKRLRISFACVGHYPNQCIPYEKNEHLLGTTNDCDEYFKTW